MVAFLPKKDAAALSFLAVDGAATELLRLGLFLLLLFDSDGPQEHGEQAVAVLFLAAFGKDDGDLAAEAVWPFSASIPRLALINQLHANHDAVFPQAIEEGAPGGGHFLGLPPFLGHMAVGAWLAGLAEHLVLDQNGEIIEETAGVVREDAGQGGLLIGFLVAGRESVVAEIEGRVGRQQALGRALHRWLRQDRGNQQQPTKKS